MAESSNARTSQGRKNDISKKAWNFTTVGNRVLAFSIDVKKIMGFGGT